MSDTEDAFDIHSAHGHAKNADDKDKGSKAKGNQKAKDLSHVPCKFFKVGSCTAGASCPFSHQEPGQPKDVCTWFVKGNCKFGHKCALAHVLPGQSMSMDRRNKKAAQAAVGQKEGGAKVEKAKGNKPQSNLSASLRVNNQGRNSLLTGSTAPTRILATSTRPPMSISKGMPVPAAPAPALDDTDFDSNIVRSAKGPDSASTTVPSQDSTQETKITVVDDTSRESTPEPIKRPLLPTSIPSNSMRLASTQGISPPIDFGPVGSPPRSTSSASHLNNFSPSASPRDATSRDPLKFTTSPFSAPSSRSLFMAIEGRGGVDEPSMESGLSNPIESKRHIIGSLPISRQGLYGNNPNLDDGNMEDFIPSSLSDLLTPGEQTRRMNRTASNNPTPGSSIPRPTIPDPHHRHSHSVPASSVLNDLKSIWSDPEPKKESPFTTRPVNFNGGRGLSPSVINSPGFNPSSSFPGEEFSQAGLLSPSNASAAFLPGIHQHFATRTTANMAALSLSDANASRNRLGGLSSTDFRTGALGNAAPEPTLTAPPSTETFNIPRSMYMQSSMGLPIPSKATYTTPELPLSPSAKALQAHAPGQSLPQGLAAGYSRIHAQPPQPFPASMNSGSALSPPPVELSVGSPDQLRNNTSPRTVTFDSSVYDQPDAGGLSTMFARYTYSAAVSGAGAANQSPSSSAMSRRSSGRGWNSHVLSSPLSGPVLSNDDDLFAFDEEK